MVDHIAALVLVGSATLFAVSVALLIGLLLASDSVDPSSVAYSCRSDLPQIRRLKIPQV